MYLWLKFLHIFFMISWFAGLFYLPRIFVNLAMANDETEYARLLMMARKLFYFMTPWGVGALVLGIFMPLFYLGFPAWIHGKITIGVMLAAYHVWCGFLLRNFMHKRNRRTHRWFRVFNELPVFALLMALYLVVLKPF